MNGRGRPGQDRTAKTRRFEQHGIVDIHELQSTDHEGDNDEDGSVLLMLMLSPRGKERQKGEGKGLKCYLSVCPVPLLPVCLSLSL